VARAGQGQPEPLDQLGQLAGRELLAQQERLAPQERQAGPGRQAGQEERGALVVKVQQARQVVQQAQRE
jgi:hypothetical protein